MEQSIGNMFRDDRKDLRYKVYWVTNSGKRMLVAAFLTKSEAKFFIKVQNVDGDHYLEEA